MNTLESIGALFLIGCGVYLMMQYHAGNDEFENKKRKFIKHSDSVRDFFRKYHNSINEGNPIMSERSFNRFMKKMMSDVRIIEEVKFSIEVQEQAVRKWNDLKRAQRKIGYKYQEEIFEMFNVQREIPGHWLQMYVRSKFKLETTKELNDLVRYWLDNELIERCPWDERRFQVGSILEDESYSLDENDITRAKWLKQKGLELLPCSKESKEHWDGLPF